MIEKRKRALLALAALAIAVAVVNASVFVYYGLTVNIIGTTAEVRFATGDNSNKNDLAGETITVTLEGSYNTKASITIHPTNEKTYYRDVLRIENYGVDHTYYGWIKVNTPISDDDITSANLYVKDSDGNIVATINLKEGGVQPASPFYITIPAATSSGDPPTDTPGTLYIDIEIQISRNVNAGTKTGSAVLELIYSPQYSERP